MNELLEVGRIVRPHGLKGQVVVELWTNRHERVAPGSVLIGPSGGLRIVHASKLAPSGGRERWLVKLDSVEDRAAAEQLRDAVLKAEPLDEAGALWVHELVGRTVTDSSGTHLGVVRAVEANPASDLMVLEDGRLIPLHFVVDASEEALTVDLPDGLLDL